MSNKRAYLDNNATTKPLQQAIDKMTEVAANSYGNPSTFYEEGRVANAELANARAIFAKHMATTPDCIFFASSGTEANNIAIRSVISFQRKHFGRSVLITSAVEHSSVAFTCKTCGCEVVEIQADSKGRVDPNVFQQTLMQHQANIGLVSIMHAQNEVGTVNDIRRLAAIKNQVLGPSIPFHTDATQSLGKYYMYPNTLGVDMMTGSSHKFHGPRGVGIIYANKLAQEMLTPPFCPITGGGQERGVRPGTENVAAIAGAAVAFDSMLRDPATKRQHIEHMDMLKRRLMGMLAAKFPQVRFHGDPKSPFSLCNTVNFSLAAIPSSADAAKFLDGRGVSVAAGSACSRGVPSRVLKALRLPENEIRGTFRVSFAFTSTVDDVDRLVDGLQVYTVTKQ